MLTVGLLTTYEQGATVGQWAWFAATQLVGGAVVGSLVGLIGVAVLRRLELGVEGIYPIAVGAIGALAYGTAAAAGASGFVAVYATGILIGALVPRHRRSILGFHEAVANLAEIALFLLLGLLVSNCRPSPCQACWSPWFSHSWHGQPQYGCAPPAKATAGVNGS
jgi:cell volume regulation protein A